MDLRPCADWLRSHFLLVAGDTRYTDPSDLVQLHERIPFEIYYTVDPKKEGDGSFALLRGLASPMFMPTCFLSGNEHIRDIDVLVVQGAYEVKNWPFFADVLLPELADLSWMIACAGYEGTESETIREYVFASCAKYGKPLWMHRLRSRDVAEMMRRAKVVPIFSHSEGTSRVASEAIACGCIAALWSGTATHTRYACPPGRIASFDGPADLRKIVHSWVPPTILNLHRTHALYDFAAANDLLRRAVAEVEGEEIPGWRYMTTEGNAHFLWMGDEDPYERLVPHLERILRWH